MNPAAATDEMGRLRVGAAVGTGGDREQRIEALIAAGCDVICIDTALGHMKPSNWPTATPTTGGWRSGSRSTRRGRRLSRQTRVASTGGWPRCGYGMTSDPRSVTGSKLKGVRHDHHRHHP